MDKDRAKELLRAIHSCQESGCQDDCDAACAMLESDPELQAWYEEEMGGWSEFDVAVAKKLECCREPEGLKERCCKAAPLTGRLTKFLLPTMAAAALFMVGFFLFGGGFADRNSIKATPLNVVSSGRGLEDLRSDMVKLVSSRDFELHHMGEKVDELKSWLASAGSPSGDLKACIICKEGVGCAILDWGAQKVSMICIKDKKFGGAGVVHIFVIDRTLFKEEEVEGLVAKSHLKSGLQTGGFADDDKVYVLVGDDPEVSVESLL